MTSPFLTKGFSNIGGYSCFIDSILFALLVVDDPYLRKEMLEKKITAAHAQNCSKISSNGVAYIEKIQQVLRGLSKAIHTGYNDELTCKPLISKLKRCNSITEELLSGDQQDDSEFLLALMDIFNINPTRVETKRLVSNDTVNWLLLAENKDRLPILQVIPQGNPMELTQLYQTVTVNDYNSIDRSQWPKKSDGTAYRYSKETVNILSSELLIFHVSRQRADGTKNTACVLFAENIKDKASGVLFDLRIVTVHHGGGEGGHYTAYIKHGGVWLHYDDLADEQTVTSARWEDVIRQGSQNSSLFVYVRS